MDTIMITVAFVKEVDEQKSVSDIFSHLNVALT